MILQRLRQVPAIKRGERFDAVGEQFVHQPFVKIQAFRIRRTGALRKDSGPRDRESVRVRPEILHHLHVLLIEMIVVVGYIRVVTVFDLPRCMRIGVPDGLTAAILLNGAFDLIRRRSRASEKSLRKGSRAIRRRAGLIICWLCGSAAGESCGRETDGRCASELDQITPGELMFCFHI